MMIICLHLRLLMMIISLFPFSKLFFIEFPFKLSIRKQNTRMKSSHLSSLITHLTHLSTTGDRFCVKLFSSAHRNLTIENTRRHIGQSAHSARYAL